MVRITDVREITKPISSPIRNAYIDFTKMTTSLVAVVTDVVRDGKRVVGYGFNSNGRYGQGGLIRERFAPRLLEADPKSLLDAFGDNLDPDKVWIEIVTEGIQQRFRIGLKQPRRKPLADQAALPVPSVGIEAVADHALAVAHHVSDDGHEAGR